MTALASCPKCGKHPTETHVVRPRVEWGILCVTCRIRISAPTRETCRDLWEDWACNSKERLAYQESAYD